MPRQMAEEEEAMPPPRLPRLHSFDASEAKIAMGARNEKRLLSRSQSDMPQAHHVRQGRIALDQRCREVNELIAQVHEARRRTDLALQLPSGPREDLDYGAFETANAPYAQAYKHCGSSEGRGAFSGTRVSGQAVELTSAAVPFAPKKISRPGSSQRRSSSSLCGDTYALHA